MTVSFWNIAIYSLQLAALTAVAVIAASALRLRAPRFSWRYWQLIMLAALLLPAVQPMRADVVLPTLSSVSVVTLDTPREALAAKLGVDAATMLLWIAAGGIFARLLWLALGLFRVRSLTRNATTDDAIAPLVNALNQSLGTTASVRISDELEGPATMGIRKPVVLLPRSVLGMSTAVQRAIITHELVHVTRRDWLHTIAEELWCALLWFHPAARVIASRLSLARETVVDETTIRLTRDRRAYAEALLAFSNPQPHVIGVTPFIGRRTLSQRIALIAEEGPMSRRHAFASLVLALVASAGLTAATVDRFPMSATVQKPTVYRPGRGITLPQVVKEVKPAYTSAAMQAKIQGSVWLECVVDASGDITDVTVTRSLDTEYGLDNEAVKAAKQWKFKPGRKDGQPVAVIVTIELTFTLKK